MKILSFIFVIMFCCLAYAENEEPKEGDRVCYAVAEGEAAYVVGWHNKSIDLAKIAALETCNKHFQKECTIEICFIKK